MFPYFSPIRADRSHLGGHWQDRSLLCTLLLHSWLQMERAHFTWLILASCSDASASIVLWCQRRASGLDKTPHGWIPALSVSLRAVRLSVHLRPRMVSRLSRPLTSQVSGAAETVKTHRNVYYMYLFRWIFSYIITTGACVSECVCMCVCLIYSGQRTITLT